MRRLWPYQGLNHHGCRQPLIVERSIFRWKYKASFERRRWYYHSPIALARLTAEVLAVIFTRRSICLYKGAHTYTVRSRAGFLEMQIFTEPKEMKASRTLTSVWFVWFFILMWASAVSTTQDNKTQLESMTFKQGECYSSLVWHDSYPFPWSFLTVTIPVQYYISFLHLVN